MVTAGNSALRSCSVAACCCCTSRPALSRDPASRTQGTPEGVRPLCDLCADRRDLHAVHADRPARTVGLGLSSRSGRWRCRAWCSSCSTPAASSCCPRPSTSRWAGWCWWRSSRCGIRWMPGPWAGCWPRSFYTLGTYFYHRESIRFSHAIWHLFVIGGSVCHFIAWTAQVLLPGALTVQHER